MVKPKSTVLFSRPKTRRKPRWILTKPPFSAALTDSTAILLFIETAPGRRSERNALCQGKVCRGCRHRAIAAGVLLSGQHDHRHLGRAAHGLGEVAGLKKASTKRTAPARDTVAVGSAVSRQAPAGAPVEVVLVGEAPVARGKPGRKDKVTKLGRNQARVQLAVKEDRLLGKGAYAALGSHELEGLCDSGARQGIRRRVRPAKRVTRVPDDVVDVVAGRLVRDQ